MRSGLVVLIARKLGGHECQGEPLGIGRLVTGTSPWYRSRGGAAHHVLATRAGGSRSDACRIRSTRSWKNPYHCPELIVFVFGLRVITYASWQSVLRDRVVSPIRYDLRFVHGPHHELHDTMFTFPGPSGAASRPNGRGGVSEAAVVCSAALQRALAM